MLVEDPDFGGDAGCWILDTRYWILNDWDGRMVGCGNSSCGNLRLPRRFGKSYWGNLRMALKGL